MSTRLLVAGISLGGFLALIGSLAVGLVPWIVENAIRDGIKIDGPTSPLYDSFKNSSAKGVAVYKTFHIYNVLNPTQVVAGTERPHVEMRGPYTVREFETYNESVTNWRPNATMRYRSFTVYKEVAGDFSDELVVPHLSLFAGRKAAEIVDALGKDSPTWEALVSSMVEKKIPTLLKQPLFVRLNVSQILYGYNDTLMDGLLGLFGQKPTLLGLNTDSNPEGYANPDATDECYTGGKASSSQPAPPENSYRWMTMWHDKRIASYWGSEWANTIAGTDATAYHPFLKKGEPLLVWVNSLLRKVWLTFDSDVDVKGITAHRYIIDPSELLSESKVPANAAYYMSHDGFISSPPSVVSHPINFSKAMFLDCDMSVVNITGPKQWPRDQLDTFMDIEPMTGTLMRVHKRLQMNLQLSPFSWYTDLGFVKQPWPQFEHVTHTMLPALWLDQHMELPDSIIDDLKNHIFLPLLLSKVLGGLAIAFGLVIIIAAVVARVLAIKREERNYKQHEFYLLNDDGK